MVTQTFPAEYSNKNVLENFLDQRFGEGQYSIRGMRGSDWVITVPMLLTTDEIAHIRRRAIDASHGFASDQSRESFDNGNLLLLDKRHSILTQTNDPEATLSNDIEDVCKMQHTEEPLSLGAVDRISLAGLLSNAMQPCVLDGTKEFLPHSELQRICTFDNVIRELKEFFQEEQAQSYAAYVCGKPLENLQPRDSALKVFAILALIHELDSLPRFVESQIYDRDLPFIWGPQYQLLCSQRRQNAGNHTVEEHCFKKNEQRFMRDFYRQQWTVLVPFIAKTGNMEASHYVLETDTIMPWTSFEPVAHNGGYCEVFKVKIHPDQHAFYGNEVFALKVLTPGDNEEFFQKELYALRKAPPGPHVVNLFATFTQGDKSSFLFPWAEQGSLRDLMIQDPSEVLTSASDSPKELIRWIAEQCTGLAQGLNSIHNLNPAVRRGRDAVKREWENRYGIHGNVKPENILRFFSEGYSHMLGELKLSDFRLADFHDTVSKPSFSSTYDSPEQSSNNYYYVSRKSDIWALGCVFTELLTWAARGRESLEAYGQDRLNEKDLGRSRDNWLADTFFGKDFRIDGTTVIPEAFFVKRSVHKCIEENKEAVSGAGHESSYLIDFLDFIRDRMLVIDYSKRATSREVSEFLRDKMEYYFITLPDLDAQVTESVVMDSDIESIFSAFSAPSSQTSFNEVTQGAIVELVQLLLGNEDLKGLYPSALSLVGPQRFRRNFPRLLKMYGQRLHQEARNEPQRQAAQFIRRSRHQAVAMMARKLEQGDGISWSQRLDSFGSTARQARVNEWLDQSGADEGQINTPLAATDTALKNEQDEFESSDSENEGESSLPSLNEVKEFMISADAFLILCREFRVWLKLDKEDDNESERTNEPPVNDKKDINITDHQPSPEQDHEMEQDAVSFSAEPKPTDPSQSEEEVNGGSSDGLARCTVKEKITLWLSMWKWLTDSCFPPPPGFQRLYYTCGCGELTYLDVRELSTGGLMRFEQNLLSSVAAVRSRPQASNTPAPVAPRPPPQAHVVGARAANQGAHASPNSLQTGQAHLQPSKSSGLSSTSNSNTNISNQRQEPQYLLLCINTRNSTTLDTIVVSSITNDQYLFESILDRYRQVRAEHEWTISRAIPPWIRRTATAVAAIATSWLPILSTLADYLSAFLSGILPKIMSLHKIASGDFVQFYLVPVGLDCCPRSFKTRDFPPQKEVTEGRYIYKPFPMEDALVADIPLPHLLKPGPHTGLFWKLLFPKKLQEGLSRPGGDNDNGQLINGWGIRINESLNWVFILFWLMVILILIGVGVIVYIAITSDHSSGFGLGALLAAMLTVYMTYQFLAWKEEI